MSQTATTRIDRIFADLRRDGRKAIMPFITAGYPSLDHTAALLRAMQPAGASVVELGIPFSDPIADGPIIQASMTDALAAGTRPRDVLKTVRQVRDEVDLGIVAMVSWSIVARISPGDFITEAKAAGLDGFIFPDLPLEEAPPIVEQVRDAGLSCSLLIAPTTPAERAAKIAELCSGFIYAIARTGITGEQEKAPEGLDQRIAELRRASDLPIAVGFGIAKPDHVKAVVCHADAAIVGSAIVRQITKHKAAPPDEMAQHVGRFVEQLATGL
jgi:tryptophan synthase alpha chain